MQSVYGRNHTEQKRFVCLVSLSSSCNLTATPHENRCAINVTFIVFYNIIVEVALNPREVLTPTQALGMMNELTPT